MPIRLTALLAALLLASAARCQDEAPASFTVRTAEELIAAVDSGGGCTVRLEPGSYVLDAPLVIAKRNHVNLFGSGWNTTIVRRGEGEAIVFEDAAFCTISDLMVVGDGQATVGILYRGQSSSNTIRSCRISSFTTNGVRYDGDSATPMSTNSVRDCHFIDNRDEQLRGLWNNDFYIVGNQFGFWRERPRVGCALIHCSAGSYTLNYHWGNDIALILGPGADYNRIENNRLEQSRTSALVIGNPETADQWNRFNSITGNTFHTNSEGNSGLYDAVVAFDAHDTIFSSNQVFSWYPPETRHKSALVLGRGCADWIVTGNILRHHTADAIVAEPDSGHLIKDNLSDEPVAP